jgi:hypothetical protein
MLHSLGLAGALGRGFVDCVQLVGGLCALHCEASTQVASLAGLQQQQLCGCVCLLPRASEHGIWRVINCACGFSGMTAESVSAARLGETSRTVCMAVSHGCVFGFLV